MTQSILCLAPIVECRDIVGCAVAETCTNGSDQQCSKCAAGYTLVDGATDTCLIPASDPMLLSTARLTLVNKYVDLTIDFLFLFDNLLMFFTTYFNKYGVEVTYYYSGKITCSAQNTNCVTDQTDEFESMIAIIGRFKK